MRSLEDLKDHHSLERETTKNWGSCVGILLEIEDELRLKNSYKGMVVARGQQCSREGASCWRVLRKNSLLAVSVAHQWD